MFSPPPLQPILDIDFECCRNKISRTMNFRITKLLEVMKKKSTLGNDQKTSFTNAIECFSPTKNRLLFFLAPNWLLIFLLKVATAGWDPQLWWVKLSPCQPCQWLLAKRNDFFLFEFLRNV